MKTYFKKFSLTAILSLAIVFSLTRLVWGWTNPTANPPTGAGAISVSSGNVGIGTTNPTAKLQIFDAGSDKAAYKFTESSSSGYETTFNMDDTGLDIGHNSASRSLNFITNNNDRLTITGDGNVGIGTASPGEKLDVAGNIRVTSNSSMLKSSAWSSYQVFSGTASSFGSSGTGFYTKAGGYLQFVSSVSGTPTDTMLLKEGGVGINQTSPDANYKLTVGSQSSSNSGAKIETTSATNPAIYAANAGGGAAIKVDSGKGVITAQGGLVIETRSSDPTSPVAGQIWLRTDL